MRDKKIEYQIRRTLTHFVVISGVVPELFTQEGLFLTHNEAEQFVHTGWEDNLTEEEKADYDLYLEARYKEINGEAT